jgi:hypothetical protein
MPILDAADSGATAQIKIIAEVWHEADKTNQRTKLANACDDFESHTQMQPNDQS